ncbi:MAG: ABC transporter permease [Selenomonadaceae bacterium]|nr:ABC transporter permease [Selenomonadaceae bacterium]
MGFFNSFKDEINFLFSGKGMPYEKVCLTVATIIGVVLSVLLAGNFAKDAPVIVIDIDNSRLSREIITQIDSSEYMRVKSVINTPADPKIFFFRDEVDAVIYFPQDFEKNFYTNTQTPLGIFYDNSNTAQTANIKEAMNEIIAINNAMKNSATFSGGLTLNDRNLFNPAGSTSNTQTLGFLFFFGSMFFVFATIGMVPRLKLTKQLEKTLIDGTPWDLIGRILPYSACMVVSFFFGMAILRVWGDLVFSGRILDFLLIQVVYAVMLGILSVFIGWTASNPGIASSRMILFIPGGFILGGVTSPLSHLSPWVVTLSHIFPLTWEFHFTRDIIQRGANLSQISSEIGAFLVYVAIIAVLLCLRFNFERNKLLKSSAIENLDTPPDLKPESIIKNILVPTDGSGQAFKALLQAISVAEAWGARLTLFMVVKIEDDIADFEKVSLSGYIPSELMKTAYEFLNELRQVVPTGIDVKIRVEVGEPAEEIVNEAAKCDYDLIIMGNRGFGGFDEENIGSVAKFVQKNCSKPVIFARGMPEDWDDENNFLGGKNIWK